MSRSARVALATLLAACACSPREVEDQRQKLLDSWGRDVLLVNYAELEDHALELESRAAIFCEAPSEAGLASARDAWWAARGAWKRSEVFAFGPYQESPWRLGSRIDFWPARPESIEMVLVSEEPLTPEAVDLLGAAAKGLPVLEYLLYPMVEEAVEPFVRQPRRCEYLIAISADLRARASEIRAAWDPEGENYLAELVEAGRGSTSFMSLHAALGEIVNRMAFTLENIRADKLGKPLGTSAGGEPQPTLLESPFSGRSVEDIRDNVRGINTLFFGDPSTGALGLDAYLDAKGRHFDLRMRTAIDALDAALVAIDAPLSQAIYDDPGGVEAAIERAGELQRLIQVDVINALSLTVSFNDNDGD